MQLAMMCLVIVISIILVLLAVGLIKRKKPRGFPEPPGRFFVGHGLDIGSTTDILKSFSKYLEYGSTIKLNIVQYSGLLTIDHKFIEFLLTSNQILSKSWNYLFLRRWLGKGLLISNGETWRQHRKLLTPAFHFEILKQFVSVFESVGEVLVQKIRDGSSIDLCPLLSLCTLDAICETAMGKKIDAQIGKNSQYVHAVQEMCRITIERCLNPLKIFSLLYRMTKDYRKETKALNILHSFSSKVISEKQKALEAEKNPKKMAFLNMMLKFAEESTILTEEVIQNQVDTFMFAGHDTTAAAICFTLFSLANHPEIQENVLNEQEEIFSATTDPIVTHGELQEMKYLELVIKETLRLYPPVPIIGRATEQDFEFGRRSVPKDTNIGINIYAVHRNPQYFPDPEKFDPDRFLNFDSSHPFAFIPFSAGPRNCIGQKFAMLEMKSIVSKIVRNFELYPASPIHELQLAAETVLTSTNGIKVGLKRRNGHGKLFN